MTGFGGQVLGAVQRAATWWVLAQPGDPDPTSGKDPEWGKAAPAGLLIWLFMGAALFFLIKSMNRHIKRVPKSFGGEPVGAAGSVQDQPDGDAVAEGGGGDERVEELVVAEGERPAAGVPGGVEDGAGGVERPADQQ